MSASEYLEIVREQILLQMNRMREMFPEHEGTIESVKFFFSSMPVENLMEHIIEKVLPWKEKIVKRNTDFFLKNLSIFGGLPSNQVNFFAKMIKNGEVSTDDENELFDFFDVYIECAEAYQKVKKD